MPRARFALTSVNRVGLDPCQGNPAGSLRSTLTGIEPHPKNPNRRAKRNAKRANKREGYPKEQRISGSWISLS
jgi:hypothetical protein